MVDVVMHKTMYPGCYDSKPDDEIVELDSLVEIPPREFFLLLPSEVTGYSMQTKRWGKN